MEMAKYIMSILRTQLMIMWSWGSSNFIALPNNEGLIFHVQGYKFVKLGYKFKGWVKVIYDEGADLFNIQYLTNKMKEVEEQRGVYFDMLVETIDSTIEKTTDYEQRVKQQYALV